MTTVEKSGETRRRYGWAEWAVVIVAAVSLRLVAHEIPELDHWYVHFGALLLILATFEVVRGCARAS